MTEINLNGLSALLLAFAGSLFVSWFSIPLVVKVASLRNLTDPPGQRKIHKRVIPTLGGVGIFAGFTFGFLMAINGYMQGVTYILVVFLLLFFVGLKDDLVTLNPKKRLVAEIFGALILIYFTDIRLTNFHGFLGINNIPVWLTYFTTIFILIVIINALNLIDGIDGLATSTGIIASVTLGLWFWISGAKGYAIMAAALTGTLTSFMRFNLSKGKNKIFMGDTGSLLVGVILAIMTIRFNEINAGSSSFHKLTSAPAISIAILIVPLFDTLRVFTVRILKGDHPFTADNRHIHHMMLRAGFSHRRSTFFISLVHICIIALAFSLDHIGIISLCFVLLTVCVFSTGVVYLLVYRNYMRENTTISEYDIGMIQVLAYVYNRLNHKGVQPYTPEFDLTPGTISEEPDRKASLVNPPSHNLTVRLSHTLKSFKHKGLKG